MFLSRHTLKLSSSVFNKICAKTTYGQHGTYMRKSCLQTLEAKMDRQIWLHNRQPNSVGNLYNPPTLQ